MGDNGAPDRPENFTADSHPRSPWKTSAAASPPPGADSESWPALSDAQQRSKCNGGADSNPPNSPPPPMEAGTDACADPPTHSAPVGATYLDFYDLICCFIVCINALSYILSLIFSVVKILTFYCKLRGDSKSKIAGVLGNTIDFR